MEKFASYYIPLIKEYNKDMKLSRWHILPILILLKTNLSIGMPLVKTTYIYAQDGESLRQILELKIGIPKSVLDDDGYFKKIKLWNPNIDSFDNLKHGERIYVEIPYKTILSPKTKITAIAATPAKTIEKRLPKRTMVSTNKKIGTRQELNGFLSKKSEINKNISKKGFSVFYALSKGTFQEKIFNSEISTTANQDSPVTIGLSGNKEINYDWNISASAYFSKLDGGTSSNNGSVRIPLEYGLNSYLGYNRENWPIEIYAGLDHEKFSSFNTDELPSGEPLSTRQHNISYYTFGLSKKFELFGQNLLTKASFSQSFASSQSKPSKINPKEFEGTKFIFYINVRASKDWYYHAFYKQHNLEGATSLHMTRVGVGVGYNF